MSASSPSSLTLQKTSVSKAATTEASVPKRILVVDDDAQVAELIQMMLEQEGHVIKIAFNAEQALRLFEAGTFDLVTTDLNMPGLSGLELASSIKRQSKTKPIPIILISGSIEQSPLDPEKLAHVDAVLCKPFLMAEFLSTVTRVCNKSPIESNIDTP